MEGEQRQAILAVANDMSAFEKSGAVNNILSAQRHYRAALRDLFESRLEASRYVQSFVDRLEGCIQDEVRVSGTVSWDNKAYKDASMALISELLNAKLRLELCAAGLRVKDFDLDEDIEKDTLCIMDEAREYLVDLAGEEDDSSDPQLF